MVEKLKQTVMYSYNVDDKHCNNHKMYVHYKQFCDGLAMRGTNRITMRNNGP